MRTVRLLFITASIYLVFQFALSTNTSLANGQELLIQDNCVNEICLGDNVQVLNSLRSRYVIYKVDLQIEGLPAPAFRVMKDNSHVLDIEYHGDSIYRIFVYSDNVRTEEDIAVGVKLKKLVRTYKDVAQVGYGEGGVYISFNAKKSLAFKLDTKSIPRDEHHKIFIETDAIAERLNLLRDYTVYVDSIIIHR